MFRKKVEQQYSGWADHIASGIHNYERDGIFKDKEAWKFTGRVISVVVVFVGLYWGAVNTARCVAVSNRLSRTPTSVPQGIESTPPIGDFLWRGSQRWGIEVK